MRRELSGLYAHRSTVACAVKGCTVCSYRLLVQPNSEVSKKLRPNQRPENCLRVMNSLGVGNEEVEESGSGGDYVKDMFLMNSTTNVSKNKILVVGDGDMSFAISLAAQMKDAEILTSSLHSEQELIRIYPNAKENITKLRTHANAKVFFKIDATRLESYEDLNSSLLSGVGDNSDEVFLTIVFNFPCIVVDAGKDGQASELAQNKSLVSDFLSSCERLFGHLSVHTGKVLIAHKTKEPFSWWDIESLCSGGKIVFGNKVVFDASNFPGYKPKKVSFNHNGQVINTKNSFPTFDAVYYSFAYLSSCRGEEFEDIDVDSRKLFTADLLQDSNKEIKFLKVTDKRLDQLELLLQIHIQPTVNKRKPHAPNDLNNNAVVLNQRHQAEKKMKSLHYNSKGKSTKKFNKQHTVKKK